MIIPLCTIPPTLPRSHSSTKSLIQKQKQNDKDKKGSFDDFSDLRATFHPFPGKKAQLFELTEVGSENPRKFAATQSSYTYFAANNPEQTLVKVIKDEAGSPTHFVVTNAPHSRANGIISQG